MQCDYYDSLRSSPINATPSATRRIAFLAAAILGKITKYARGGKQATVLDQDMIKTIEASLRDGF